MQIQSKSYHYEKPLDRVKAAAIITTGVSLAFCAVARNITLLKVFSATTYGQVAAFALIASVTKKGNRGSGRFYDPENGDYKIGQFKNEELLDGSMRWTEFDGLVKESTWSQGKEKVIRTSDADKVCEALYDKSNYFELSQNNFTDIILRKGKTIWANGDHFVGTYDEDGKFLNGNGKKTFIEASEQYVCVGEFKEGVLVKGKRNWTEGTYKGYHFDGTFSGTGQPLVGVGRLIIHNVIYEGRFKQNHFGQTVLVEGESKEENGDHFKGTFNDYLGPLTGTGRLTRWNGILEGEFEDGSLHGQGIEIRNNLKYEGLFEHEAKKGKFKVTNLTDGSVKEETY